MSRKIRRIIVHHSAGPRTETVEAVRRLHTQAPPRGRGWSDIGYHFLVRFSPEHGWLVEAGRPVKQAGAHDQGQNADSIGICLLGDYSSGALPPPAAWWLLVGLVAGLLVEHGLGPDDCEGHRENEPASTSTQCPGFAPGELRHDLRQALGGSI